MLFGDDGCGDPRMRNVTCIDWFGHDRKIPSIWRSIRTRDAIVDSCR